MDARTKKRMAAMQDLMSLLRAKPDFREYLAPGEAPVIIALPDDSVGNVLRQMGERSAASGETSYRVIMRLPKHRGEKRRSLHWFCVNATGINQSAADDEPVLPVSVDSEWRMLVDYLMLNPGPTHVQALASVLGFELVGSRS